MSIGGLVGGANIIDQIAGRVDPNRVIARINGKDISPEYFNNLVNQQINQAKANGQQINDMQYERARTSAWNNLVQEVLVNAEIEKRLNEPFPARSTIQVAGLPMGANVEVECLG